VCTIDFPACHGCCSSGSYAAEKRFNVNGKRCLAAEKSQKKQEGVKIFDCRRNLCDSGSWEV
jgi:hypothetical protein